MRKDLQDLGEMLIEEAKRLDNRSSSKLAKSIFIESDFNQWFDATYDFRFGTGWMKGIFKKVAFKSYLAGYNLQLEKKNREMALGRMNYK